MRYRVATRVGMWMLSLSMMIGGLAPPAPAQDTPLQPASLVERLAHPEAEIRDEAEASLREAGESARDALLTGLDHWSTLVRWKSVVLLGELGDPELAGVYIRVLESDDFQIVRRAAALALARTRDPRARDQLLAYMRVDPVVGAEALGILGDRAALPEMLDLLIDAEDRMEDLRKLRSTNRPLFEEREPVLAGTLVVLSSAVCRLGCRGGLGPLLDTLKYTEWVGLYARKVFKEYLADQMPDVMPPTRRDMMRDALAASNAVTKFLGENLDVYVNPADQETPSEALREKVRALARLLDDDDVPRERKDRVAEILTRLSTPILPVLLEEFASEEMYLDEEIYRILYWMNGPIRYARTPRVSKRNLPILRETIRTTPDPRVRGELVKLLGELLHWYPFFREIENLAENYDPETYRKIVDLRAEAKNIVLENLDPALEPEVHRGALEALRKLGDADIVEPVQSLLRATNDDDVRVAGIRCLEWVRFEAGRAALQAGDFVYGNYSPRVQLRAACSLALVGDGQGIPLLLQALESEEEEARALAVDTLRAVGNRYLGYDPQADPASQPEPIERWQRWYDENLETVMDLARPEIARIREQEFRLDNHTLRRTMEMERTLRDLTTAENARDRLFQAKHYYAYQKEFLRFLIEHFGEVQDPEDRLLVANLISSRFDKRYGLPFLLGRLDDEDPRVQVTAIDTIGLMPRTGWTPDESEPFLSPLRRLAEDPEEEHLVRISAARTLAELGEVAAMSFLIDCLQLITSEVENAGWIREEAVAALREITSLSGRRQTFGYESNAPRVLRDRAAEQWRQWWEGASDSFRVQPSWMKE